MFVIKLIKYQTVKIFHYKYYTANINISDVVLLNANQNL